MKHNIFILVISGLILCSQVNAQSIRVGNNSRASLRPGFYAWSVYIIADPYILSTIQQVIYTLDPTFSNPVITISASSRNKNFSYKASGWGEFDIKVKIVFINPNRAPLYLKYHLKLE